MHFIKNHFIPFVLIAAAILVVLNVTFPHGILGINDYQFIMSGDGFKNYYTFAYAAKFNSSFWFDGYQYPYGDLGLYTDNQPILSWISSKLYSMGLLHENNMLGWIHSLCILGYLLSGWFVYLILKEFDLPSIYSIIVAVFAVLVSPQIFKIAGHFGLSYAFVLPMYWWVLLQIAKDKSVFYCLCLSMLTLVVGYIHPYLMLSLVLFGLTYVLSKGLLTRKFDSQLLIWTVAPLLLFLVIGMITDPIADRPGNPAGVWSFKTEVRDLFPVQGWFNDYFGSTFVLKDHHSESYSYPGFLFLILLFGLPIFLIARYSGYKWVRVVFKINIEQRIYLYSGLFVLAFAMGIHILLTGGMILEWLPPLSQFRALGRFSWGFYYVFAVISSVWVYNAYKYISSRWIGGAFLALLFTLYALDTYSIHALINKNLSLYGSENLLVNNTTIADLVDKSEYEISDFQAMVTLPISTEGVEKISFEDDFFVKVNALPFSYQTGMPLTSCIQSRASIGHVMKILQLGNSVYGDRSLRDDITSDKDFLLVIPVRLADIYRDLLDRAALIGRTKELLLYAATKDRLFTQTSWSEVQDSSYINMDSDIDKVFLSEFDGDGDFGLRSTGSFYSMTRDTMVMQWPLSVDTSTMFELSFWQYIEPDNSTISTYQLETFNADHTSRYLGPEFRDWDYERVEVHGNWIRFTQNILLGAEDKFLSLNVGAAHMRLDWVMMKPKELNVYKVTDSEEWIYSNHYFIKSSNH